MNRAWSGRDCARQANFPTIFLYLDAASSDRMFTDAGSFCPFSRIAKRSGGTGEALRSAQNGSFVNNSSRYCGGTLTNTFGDFWGRITCLPKNIRLPPSPLELEIAPVVLTFNDVSNDDLTSSIPFGDNEDTRRSST